MVEDEVRKGVEHQRQEGVWTVIESDRYRIQVGKMLKIHTCPGVSTSTSGNW